MQQRAPNPSLTQAFKLSNSAWGWLLQSLHHVVSLQARCRCCAVTQAAATRRTIAKLDRHSGLAWAPTEDELLGGGGGLVVEVAALVGGGGEDEEDEEDEDDEEVGEAELLPGGGGGGVGELTGGGGE